MNKGYRFEYFTYVQVKPDNKASYFCYDHGYSELENNKVIFVKLDHNED